MDVFISYSSLEQEATEIIRDVLVNCGITVQLHDDSDVSEDAMAEAKNMIDECTVFAWILSSIGLCSVPAVEKVKYAIDKKPVLIFELEATRGGQIFSSVFEKATVIKGFRNQLGALEQIVNAVRIYSGRYADV